MPIGAGSASFYYLSILGIGVANLVLALIAYVQRAKQIRGNALREQQITLAEARNELAERRLRCLDDQLTVLRQIRDALCSDGERLMVGATDGDGSGPVRLGARRARSAAGSGSQGTGPDGARLRLKSESPQPMAHPGPADHA
jgi:hypothetical protein